jgi:D-3-phosphoglycerate dehydrogenase
MNDTVADALILDLEWLDSRERSYEEIMDAWRTSRPRLPVWEDANDRKLVERAESNGRSVIRITSLGRDLPERRGRLH